MKWCIGRGLDGVITDDPKRFLEVCEEWENGKRRVESTWKQWMGILWINFMVLVFGAIFFWKHGGVGTKRRQKQKKADRGVRMGMESRVQGS